jgi:hypothetical protein
METTSLEITPQKDEYRFESATVRIFAICIKEDCGAVGCVAYGIIEIKSLK